MASPWRVQGVVLWACVSSLCVVDLSCSEGSKSVAEHEAPGSGGAGPSANGSGGATAVLAGSGGAPSPSSGSGGHAPLAGDAARGGDTGGSAASTDAAVATRDAGGKPTDASGLRDVLLVGNSVSGRVSVLDGHSFENLGSVDIIPDLDERLAEINGDVLRSVAYNGVKAGQVVDHFEPSGGERFVDDVFVSPDGNTLYTSRSNLGDVAAFDLAQAGQPMLWHTQVEGFKADHATLSPDGTKLIVSATTVDKADVIDAHSGMIVSSFPTGHYPHQNDYSADGKHIYNGSIGDVGLSYAQDAQKGARLLTVVDAQTFEVIKTYTFDKGIRPSVITADEKTMYSQQSYLNGVIKFDLVSGTIVKTLEEPLSDFAKMTYPTFDDYPHDSAHHGLALSGDGTKLCDAGTIDNTVSIVSTADMTVDKVIDTGLVPYWATSSLDGAFCLVSLSGDGEISVIEYATESELRRVPVGKFPQRNRLGRTSEANLKLLPPTPG
jgi:DNA-binding beta-propeller fold protein YncE